MSCYSVAPRDRQRLLSLCVVALLVAGCHSGQAAEGPQRPSFTAKQRQSIDDGALWSPREKQNIARVEAFGSALQWLVARTPLPVEEEIARAAKAHEEVLAKFKTLDTPASATEVLNKLDHVVGIGIRRQTDMQFRGDFVRSLESAVVDRINNCSAGFYQKGSSLRSFNRASGPALS